MIAHDLPRAADRFALQIRLDPLPPLDPCPAANAPLHAEEDLLIREVEVLVVRLQCLPVTLFKRLEEAMRNPRLDDLAVLRCYLVFKRCPRLGARQEELNRAER